MTKVLFSISLFFTFSKASFSKSVLLDESFLRQLMDKNPPTIELIEANFQSAKARNSQLKDKLNISLQGNAYYAKTREKQFSPFAPVISPIKSYQLALVRPLKYGMKVGLIASSQQTTNSFTTKGTANAIGFQLSVDLWKDLFGRSTMANLNKSNANTQQAKWEKEIKKKTFYQSSRKLYWALVANEEASRFTKKLLKGSKKQVREANRRFKNKIADSGEVAKYKSQVASRKSNIISLKYDREDIIRQLKLLIPNIADKEIRLAPYSIDKTIKNVLNCVAKIATHTKPPLQNTFYDEIISSLKEQERYERKVISKYDSPELKLNSEAKWVGKDFSHGGAYDDLSKSRKSAYNIGLSLNIPIEGKRKNTREILEMANKKRYLAIQNENMAKIKSYHYQIIKSVSLLQEVIKNQKENTHFLEKSLRSSSKKYNQARLTVQQLVQEQDAFLQSNLDEINTNLAVIYTLLDYFSVYTETPCKLNPSF